MLGSCSSLDLICTAADPLPAYNPSARLLPAATHLSASLGLSLSPPLILFPHRQTTLQHDALRPLPASLQGLSIYQLLRGSLPQQLTPARAVAGSPRRLSSLLQKVATFDWKVRLR